MSLSDPDVVRAHLVGAAAAGVALTYSDLLAHLGHRFTRPKMRALCKTLAAVDRGCAARGEPELAVLVVRQSDGLPGQGWWVGSGYEGAWEGPRAAAHVRALQQAAFAYFAETGEPV